MTYHAQKRPKICTCSRVSETKFYLYHSNKIAKARHGFDDQSEYPSVQINSSSPCLLLFSTLEYILYFEHECRTSNFNSKPTLVLPVLLIAQGSLESFELESQFYLHWWHLLQSDRKTEVWSILRLDSAVLESFKDWNFDSNSKTFL